MLKYAPVFSLALAAIALSAHAGVTFTSRLSTCRDSRIFGSIPLPSDYDESAQFDQLGVFNVTLPNGYSHYSNVSAVDGVQARFNGYSEGGRSSGGGQSYWSKVDTRFTVTGGVGVTFKIKGSMSEVVQPYTPPENANAYVVLYNADTNAIVFDSWNLGVRTIQPDFRSRMSWTDATQSLTLGAGNYRLLIGASGDNTYYTGFGQGYSGYSTLDASMTFVQIPAPGATLLPLGAMHLARRRSRGPTR